MSNYLTTPKPARSRIATVATRLAAGTAVTVATLTLLGGAAFASGGDPLPVPGPLPLEPVTDDFLPDPEPPIEIELVPLEPGLDISDLTLPTIPIPDETVPEDDGPILEIPDDVLTEIPLDIPDLPELPECEEWNPADVSVASVDNGDLTATVTLAYADPTGVCDELFVVHSTQEDAAMNPLALLAEEHVTIAELQADADHTIAVTVPLDPCYTRVFTHGPEALLMQDDHYGEGCPGETTTTTETPTETTDPPVETVPTTVPPVTPTTAPGGTLPMTGSSSTVIALIGGALVLAGGALAIGVRKSQTAAA